MASFTPALHELVSFLLARCWVVNVVLCRRRRGVNWNKSCCRDSPIYLVVHSSPSMNLSLSQRL